MIPKGPTAAKDVAAWMMEEYAKRDYLDQQAAVYHIRENFGEEFTYLNSGGGLAIARAVLTAFRKISGEEVVWSRGDLAWRKRQDYDSSGRGHD